MPVRESSCDKGKAGHFQNVVLAVDKHSLCTSFVHTTDGRLFANLHFIFLFSQLAWLVLSTRIIYIDLNFNPHRMKLLCRGGGGVPINDYLINSLRLTVLMCSLLLHLVRKWSMQKSTDENYEIDRTTTRSQRCKALKSTINSTIMFISISTTSHLISFKTAIY